MHLLFNLYCALVHGRGFESNGTKLSSSGKTRMWIGASEVSLAEWMPVLKKPDWAIEDLVKN